MYQNYRYTGYDNPLITYLTCGKCYSHTVDSSLHLYLLHTHRQVNLNSLCPSPWLPSSLQCQLISAQSVNGFNHFNTKKSDILQLLKILYRSSNSIIKKKTTNMKFRQAKSLLAFTMLWTWARVLQISIPWHLFKTCSDRYNIPHPERNIKFSAFFVLSFSLLTWATLILELRTSTTIHILTKW